MVHVILKIISVLLICYGFSIAMVNSGTRFFLIWYVFGAVLMALSEGIRTGLFFLLPIGIRGVLAGAAAAAVLVYTAAAVCIAGCFGERPDNKPRYLLVLGAQVKADGPGSVLKNRLDSAKAYLKDHPDVKAVLCGGQGRNEPRSEAEEMRRYLSDIDPERLITEDRSRTTAQNFTNSRDIIGDVPVAVVTNNFHMYRALKLAKRAGYHDVSGLAAGSRLYYLPNNLTREVAAVIKMYIRFM